MKGSSAKKYIIGIDEVGRGALAGPVVVVAAMIPLRGGKRLSEKTGGGPVPLRDSKRLSVRQREIWYAHFKNDPDVRFAEARVYPREIERLNISGAANRAALRAYLQLSRKYGNESPRLRADFGRISVFLDGGLFLGSRRAQKAYAPRATTIAKADENVPAVAVASIVAKVSRDRFMTKLAKKYPAYAFEIHKGYGTKIHRAALGREGPCEAHRLTFLKKKPIING